MRPPGLILAIAVLPVLVAGCADMHAMRQEQDAVTAAVRARVYVPESVSLDDGLSETEAAHLALCNNALFQELLADLGLAHGDLVTSGLLPNPEVVYSIQTAAKPFKYLIDLPIEAIVLRPARVRAASAEWERTRERLTQAGLDLIRDTRLAHADWVLVRERIRIAEENRQLRDKIADLTDSRFKAGDATPLEVSTAKIDRLRAKQEAIRATNDLPFAEERLRNLIGLGLYRPDLTPQLSDPPINSTADIEPLVAEAIANRPDVLAAQHGIEATQVRLRLAKLGWLKFLGIGDATSGQNGHEFSPGFRVAVPIFNWNQGGIARAAADRERAIRQLQTVRERGRSGSSPGTRPTRAGRRRLSPMDCRYSPDRGRSGPSCREHIQGRRHVVASGPRDVAAVDRHAWPRSSVAGRPRQIVGGTGAIRGTQARSSRERLRDRPAQGSGKAMNYRAGLLTGIVVTAAVAGVLALGWAALTPKSSKSEAAKTPPATVLKEDEILKITLTEKAEERIGIKLGKVEEKRVPRTRTLGGDVTAPPGHAILVAAPLNGTLKAPASGIPRAGAAVKKGDAIFQLLPLLSPDARTTLVTARVEADGVVGNARVTVGAAKITLDRAKQLLERDAGRQRDVDDAQAQFDLAQKSLAAAQARLAVLTQAIDDAEKGVTAPLAIPAPTDGLLRNVNALPGQNVPAGELRSLKS